MIENVLSTLLVFVLSVVLTAIAVLIIVGCVVLLYKLSKLIYSVLFFVRDISLDGIEFGLRINSYLISLDIDFLLVSKTPSGVKFIPIVWFMLLKYGIGISVLGIHIVFKICKQPEN